MTLARWLLDYAAVLLLFGAVAALISDPRPPHVSIDPPPAAHRTR